MRGTAKKVQEVARGIAHEETYQMASLKYAPEMADVLWEAQRALDGGMWPELSPHGSSPTYILKDRQGDPIAVFKLENFLKEYAAYRLDHQHFASVPPTILTTLTHPLWEGKRTGSLQLYIDGTIGLEYSYNALDHFSSSSVRRTALFDIRVMNADRHSSNIIVLNGSEIIPIDHGYILPSYDGGVHLSWLLWKQSHTPFDVEEREYIRTLDPEYDRKLLIEELKIKERLANRLYVSTILLQRGATYGLTPYQIGGILLSKRRGEEVEESRFSHLLEAIKAEGVREWKSFQQIVYQSVEELISEISESYDQRTPR